MPKICSKIRYYNPALISLSKGDPETSFFLSGSILAFPGYSFSAKIFDLGSDYGIEHGRISKLILKDSCGNIVADFQREWVVYPVDPMATAVVKILIAAFGENVKCDCVFCWLTRKLCPIFASAAK